MNNFRLEPFLWIHLAGIAVAPLLLLVMGLGLAVGDPLPFYWLELLLVVTVGILPILWMQWTRPFDIFSILIVAIKPNSLTPDQRKILTLLKTRKNKIFNTIAALVLLGIAWQLYHWAPLGAITAQMLPQWRILGLIIAAIAFLLSNLFIQIPVSVVGVLLTSQQQWLNTAPYDLEKILKDFTILGLRVNKIFLIPTMPPSENLKEETS
ncbi:low-complexity tail membrane protein [Crocosphaera sp. UHCC 0190]|uniref:low-complexity tail membrane protein n=1 Tax=Crocosphaera sp. UHCC 0190 TaxID=3110246 RepID=UPI002B20F574|nr:low-complexity tail membrane protein [Crocosphaera sp. UHCC 0190]MEA5510065.1 low-complexity tail membrane protein [Crocosphaera sp. UHCC 0190]